METAALVAIGIVSAFITGCGMGMALLKRTRRTETQARLAQLGARWLEQGAIWSDPHNPAGY